MTLRLPNRRMLLMIGIVAAAFVVGLVLALALLGPMIGSSSAFLAGSVDMRYANEGYDEGEFGSASVQRGLMPDGVPAASGEMDGRLAQPIEAEQPGDVDANQRRIVLMNATLTVKVSDPEAQAAAISSMAEEMDGWVVNSNTYQSNLSSGEAVTNASVTVRVPAERLNEALDTIKADALEVRAENISGQDVTQEYVDISSRLENLEAAEEQLQEILETARTAEDVLAVFNQLTAIRGEIEVARGRIQYYDEASAYSSLTVTLVPDVAASSQIQGWQPTNTVESAIVALVNVLQGLVDIVIFVIIFGLPLLLVVGVPAWFIVRTYRRRRRASTPPVAS